MVTDSQTRLLTESIDIPNSLFQEQLKSKVEAQCDLATTTALRLQKLLEANNGWLKLLNGNWYCRDLHSLFVSKLQYQYANTYRSFMDSFEYNTQKVDKVFQNYVKDAEKAGIRYLPAIAINSDEAEYIAQTGCQFLGNVVKTGNYGNYAIACKHRQRFSWVYFKVLSNSSELGDFNGTDQYQAVLLPKFPLPVRTSPPASNTPESSKSEKGISSPKQLQQNNKPLFKLFKLLSIAHPMLSANQTVASKEESKSPITPIKLPILQILADLLEHDLYPEDAVLSKEFKELKMNSTTNIFSLDSLKELLLHCDEMRFALAPYEEKLLTDIGRGHWDLWEIPSGDTQQVAIPKGQWLVARNPAADVLKGCVAIDFGTKSTVVVRLEETGKSQPMRVGHGDLRKAVESRDFENPTVMEFSDLSGFLEAYRESEGRPNTKWSQLTISHTAANALLESASEDFYAYLAELKQWAGDKARTLCIMDKKKYRLELPAYTELSNNSFDPIETYAYYLGLNINNMVQKISMDYILSFPVTYEKSVQERILESFRRGLRKSLPVALLHNEETMKQFSVSAGASEPAAYAICALKQYGFEPEENEKFAYAVFDFGGGTTDFDFGIWRAANEKTERRFDYAIEHYGAGGDSRLGGENILERLAYETYLKNENVMREKSIVFQCPSNCTPPSGFELMLTKSQEAGLNVRCLMDRLRSLWERHEGYETTFDSGRLKVDLFNEKGEKLPGLEIEVSREELEQTIYDLIDGGVSQFIYKMEQVFGRDSGKLLKGVTGGIQIFLAGNSCKSPVVKSIFEERLQKETERVNKMDKSGQVHQVQDLYHLFPPLGTDEAREIQKERECGEKFTPDSPTGKTGVAFGLIDCRRGSRVKIIDRSVKDGEIDFKYFVGYAKRGKLKPLLVPGSKYKEWVKLYEADEEVFEIYYTTLASAATGKLSSTAEGVHYQRIAIQPQKDGMIFLRALSPSVIEYTVAKESKEKPGKEFVAPTAINLEK